MRRDIVVGRAPTRVTNPEKTGGKADGIGPDPPPPAVCNRLRSVFLEVELRSFQSVQAAARQPRPVPPAATPRHFHVANRQALRLPLTHANDRHGPAAESRLTAMSAMASTLVHELSQPITASQNYLQATAYRLRSQIAGLEEMLEVLNQASAQTRKAGEIIGRMRDFMVSGTIAGQRHDLRDLVAAALASFKPALPIEIVEALAPDAVDVVADRVQIGQVLSNLLRNAADALAGSEERRITISSRAAGAMVEVRIADTGPGLSEDEIARLFEPFYTTKPTGTGLGMPLCRMIVEAHGGRIRAEPRPKEEGAGATIVFTLQAAAEG